MNSFYRFYIFLILSVPSNTVFATDYFTLDFEDGKEPPVSTGLPIWSLPQMFEANYGPNNFFEITDAAANTGRYSLRFNYEGRNNICNTCGTFEVRHKKGLDGVNYFVDDKASDLSRIEIASSKPHKRDRGPAAQPGRIIYNKSNGFSRWEILKVESNSAKNDKLSVKLLDKGINGEKPEFNGGDEVLISRQCDVDGHIGGKIDRRSDCNVVITWFDDVKRQTPGKSIFRRIYLKPEITTPGIHQKLYYFRPNNGKNAKKSIIMFAESLRSPKLQPKISGFGHYDGPLLYRPGLEDFPEFTFESGKWYYIEEQFKAATPNPAFEQSYYDSRKKLIKNGKPNPSYNINYSSDDPRAQEYNADGEYRLWMSESGKEDTDGATPLIELTGIPLPPITGGKGYHASLWGNVQHHVDIQGMWYMDDIKISDEKIGKASGGKSISSVQTLPARTTESLQ